MPKVEIPVNTFIVIDEIDMDLLDQFHWYVHKYKGHGTSYVQAHVKNSTPVTVHIHRFILARMLDRKLLPKEQVDHKNRNGLDNRRENLRLATGSQNQHNRSKYKNNTSGFKGVYWDKVHEKWRAAIRVDGKLKHLGFFSLITEARDAYREGALTYHAEFAGGVE